MKKVNKEKTEIIIVGADHHNTLGVIRALGGDYIVNLIIHQSTETEKIKCSKSKYFNGKLVIVKNDEKELLSSLSDFKRNMDGKKIAIIPTSDFAALCIDKNYDELSKYYAVPSIDHTEGRIAYYMDKFHQKELADKYGILMANSIRIDLGSDNKIMESTINWAYPYILKPLISAEGSKEDIVVVQNDDELQQALIGFEKKSYCKVLLQEFIKKDHELCIFGCITEHTRSFHYGIIDKLRYYPYQGGSSLTYAKLIDDIHDIHPILDMIKKIGYSGMFDIEVFLAGGKTYLNELNFRNSGNTWAIVNNGLNAPVIWVTDAVESAYANDNEFCGKKIFFMNETADLHYVIDHKMSVFKWFKYLFETKTFCKFWVKDIRGSLAWYKRR